MKYLNGYIFLRQNQIFFLKKILFLLNTTFSYLKTPAEVANLYK